MENLKDNSYERTYKEAKKAGKTEQVSIEFYQWEEEGQVLIGRLLEWEIFEDSEYDQVCNKYIFDTDDGLAGVICGTSMDKLIERKDLKGKILSIEYLGKKDLKGGKVVNRFRVDVIRE